MEQIIERLKKLRSEIEDLKKLNHSQGQGKFNDLSSLLRRIIDRVYPEKDAKSLKSSLIAGAYFATDREEILQRDYVGDLERAIRVISTILEEFELFGFEDFKPIKEKIETEGGIKTGLFNFKRKVTKEK